MFDQLAPRQVVLARSSDVVMGTSSLEDAGHAARLAAFQDHDELEAPGMSEADQEQLWAEPEWTSNVDAL